MFSNDDNSGVGAFLGFLIVIVLAGVFLSLVIDGNLRFSKNQRLLEEEVQAGESEVAHLSQQLSTLEVRLNEEGEARKLDAESLRATKRAMELVGARKQALGKSAEALKSACAEIGAGLSGYRVKYRESHWKQAVGRSLGVVRLRVGREYRQAVITRVTDNGLEIRHESGTARLSALELDPALQDEFQWQTVEPERAVGALANPGGTPAVEPAAPVASGGVSGAMVQPSMSPDEQVITTRREKVQAWKTKLQSLRSQRSDATSRASYGGEKSVPGSLETWSQRASALASEVARAEAELARAKAALATVSPADPLLRSAGD